MITTFTLHHNLPNAQETIYTTLLDFKKFGEVHPFMTEVTVIKENLPEYIEYSIVEEVYFLGFIKNNPTYTAKVMEIERNKHIRYTSSIKKFIFLTIDITLSKNKNGSLLVTEKFEIKSNKLMGMIFGNILKKAHLKFFENMKKLLYTSVEDVQLS